jgi:hypothetical protein
MFTNDPKELLRRTMKNLAAIEAASDQGAEQNVESYEVTQLVNSFLITVLQNWDEIAPNWAVAINGAPGPTISTSEGRRPVGECVKRIRDALAHGNMVFEADSKQEIEKVHLWTCSHKQEVDWDAEIEVSEMRKTLIYFVQVAGTLKLTPRTLLRKGAPCSR